MAHFTIVGCNKKHANNSEVTYFNLPKDILPVVVIFVLDLIRTSV